MSEDEKDLIRFTAKGVGVVVTIAANILTIVVLVTELRAQVHYLEKELATVRASTRARWTSEDQNNYASRVDKRLDRLEAKLDRGCP